MIHYTWLIGSFLTLFLCVNGVAETTEMGCLEINEALENTIMKKVEESHSQITFEGLSIHNIGANIPANCDIVRFNMPSSVDLNSDVIIKVDSYKEDQFIKRTTKIFRLEGKARVYKSEKIIYDDDKFTSDVVYGAPIDIHHLTNHMIGNISQLEGRQFRNYVDKDQIIEDWMIEKIPDIIKGDKVEAIYSKSNIKLTLDAKVIENGYIGDSIKVKLETNKKVMLGKLYDKKTVIISSR